MSLAGWITLGTLAIVGFLLATERLRPDVAGLVVLLALSLSGVISPEAAFAGFAQPAVITILAVFVITHGLERTGLTAAIGRFILQRSGPSERTLMAVLMLTAAGLSAIMVNIAAVAVLMPTTMAIARQAQLRPSRLLMPVAFGSLLGGTATLLTTANLLVSDTLHRSGFASFGLFEFAPVGIPIILIGTAVVVGLGPRLLPSRDPARELARLGRLNPQLSHVYHLHEGTCMVRVTSGSPMAGATLDEGGWGHELGLTVLGISRFGRVRLAPDRHTRVEAGDLLLLEGSPSPEVVERYGLTLDFDAVRRPSLASDEVPLVEAVLAPRSKLEGKSLREMNFRERYGLQVLAIWRGGLVLQQNLAEVPLRFGDTLLIQGPRQKVDLLREDADLLVLEMETGGRLSPRAGIAAGVLVACLAAAALGVLPVATAMLLGATLMVLAGCLTMDEAYRAIQWRAIFLVAGMLALGAALQTSGAAQSIGSALSQATLGLGGLGAAAALLVLSSTTSLFVGGQTAAVLFAPIAVYAAGPLTVDPRALAMATALGCSLAFLTPFGHPVNMLVMGPAGYSNRDYLRLGAPLTLAVLMVSLIGLHWVWGL